MHRRPEIAGRAPVKLGLDPGGNRPADRAGKSGNQGNAGDRSARIMAINPAQRGKGRLIKPHRHANTNDAPRNTHHGQTIGRTQHRKAARKDQAGHCQHRAPAKLVNPRPGLRTQQGGKHQRK
ncbi:hypothetical protein THPR109532_04875 [Thalassospira profundimaris]